MFESKRSVSVILAAVASLGLLVGGCGGKKDESAPKGASAGAKTGEKTEATANASAKTLPTETEALALDQGESKIPATIEVPKGSTTFNDSPTQIRVMYQLEREPGQIGGPPTLFGVDVSEGNEFNVELGELEAQLKENKYGQTNTILDSSPTFLSWSSVAEGAPAPTHTFQMIVDLGGKPWLCASGIGESWTKAQMERQVAACKTLKAK